MYITSKQADGADKVRKELERANLAREDQIEQLENKLKVDKIEFVGFTVKLIPRKRNIWLLTQNESMKKLPEK